jgi:putrescine aminotransferase
MNGFEAYRKHVNPVLARLEELAGISRIFMRAEGNYLYDEHGEAYLDMVAGHGSFNLGHNPPALLEKIAEYVRAGDPNISGFGINPRMGELAEVLVGLAGEFFEIAFFGNSGSEAIEGALKLARAATGRGHVIYCRGAYHGATIGCLSMGDQGPLRDPFEPLMPDFFAIPFDDIEALETALKTYPCAAFVVEPIQAEGGVIIPSQGYLKQASTLCHRYGALLVLDEIQAGLGRTGSFFTFQGEDVTPDVFTTAKSLGGGMISIGAYVTSAEIFHKAYGRFETCGIHHSTYGGNVLACRTAKTVLEMMVEQQVADRARLNGKYLLDELKREFSGHPSIKDIRGRGWLMGIEFEPSDHPWLSWENLGLTEFSQENAVPSLLMRQLLKHKVVTDVCGHNWNVLKLEPPLIIDKEDIHRFIDAFGQAMKWLDSIN